MIEGVNVVCMRAITTTPVTPCITPYYLVIKPPIFSLPNFQGLMTPPYLRHVWQTLSGLGFSTANENLTSGDEGWLLELHISQGLLVVEHVGVENCGGSSVALLQDRPLW